MFFRKKKAPVLLICPGVTEDDRKKLDLDMRAAGFTNFVITTVAVAQIFSQE